nr:MAG: putative RNA-dependent RNA polymerase [Botourmiaviridae sp.]
MIMSTDHGSGHRVEVLGPRSAAVLRDLASTLGRIFSVRLDSAGITEDLEVKKGKEFCVGLLENPKRHPWWDATRDLPQADRFSIAGSLFLLRKVLPTTSDNEAAALAKHRRILSTPLPPRDPEFTLFCSRVTHTLFPPGWDTSYPAACARFSPSGSATLCAPRRKGGQSATFKGRRNDFLRTTLLSDEHPYGESPADFDDPWFRNQAKVSVVKENGKCRVVTICGPEDARLKPLHEAIYDRLTKEKWLLRGAARPQSFKEFEERKGEVFVSGDYESATDHLDIETTEVILRVVLRNARMVPKHIKEEAFGSLRKDLRYGEDTIRQECGQLMGNYLSFPLLCLRNYLTFRFLHPRDVPLKVNGDDIVFRTTPHEAETWMNGVRDCGLILSKGKTLVDQRTFSINSTFFQARFRRAPYHVPVIRAKSLLPDGDIPTGGAYHGFLSGWARHGEEWERRRRIVGALWLRAKRRAIDALGRGVWGLGIRARPAELHTAGLVPLQAFFNPRGKQALVVPPLPPTTKEKLGFHKVERKEVRRVAPAKVADWQRQLGERFSEVSWSTLKIPAQDRFDEAAGGLRSAYCRYRRLLRRWWAPVGLTGYPNDALGDMPVAEKKDVWVPDDWTGPQVVGSVKFVRPE